MYIDSTANSRGVREEHGTMGLSQSDVEQWGANMETSWMMNADPKKKDRSA